MKIMFEPQIFSFQAIGGISRYFYELITNIDPDIHCSLPLLFTNNEYLLGGEYHKYLSFFSRHSLKGRSQIFSAVNKLYFKFHKKTEYDLIHPTYYDPYFLPFINKKPFVLTVHDMIHERYPQIFSKNDCTAKNKKMLCMKAAKIIAVSENTKRDLVEIYRVSEEKIDVVYHGQSLVQSEKYTMKLPSKYILFIGARNGYKNFRRFLKAYSLINRWDRSIKLVYTGRPLNETELQWAKEMNVSTALHHCFANDVELREIYQRALLFVFPSEYEGFGIPILEAFAAGCPVALSNASCFPEIAGDAGVYFDPLDEKSIFNAIRTVVESEDLRDELRKKGSIRLAGFSWKKTASETAKIYRGLI